MKKILVLFVLLCVGCSSSEQRYFEIKQYSDGNVINFYQIKEDSSFKIFIGGPVEFKKDGQYICLYGTVQVKQLTPIEGLE